MEIAERFGLSPREVRKLSYREFRVIRAWMDGEWNRPSRTDHYLMSILSAVLGLFRKPPDLNSLRLKFVPQEAETKKDVNQRSEEALQNWLSRLGK